MSIPIINKFKKNLKIFPLVPIGTKWYQGYNLRYSILKNSGIINFHPEYNGWKFEFPGVITSL